jgi:biotin carboxyl carrier protein
MLTLQAKLIIAAIILALIGYEQYWVFSQGEKVGKASCNVEAIKALKQALADAEHKFMDQRALEMREAAEVASQLIKNEQKKTSALQRANELLKKEHAKAIDSPMPDALVELLNGSRDSTGTST